MAVVASFFVETYEPKDEQIVVLVERDYLVYDIESARFGIHREGNTYFITVVCRSSKSAEYSPPDCHLEFSIPFLQNPEEEIRRDAEFEIPIYDQEHGNLNFFYFLGFGDIEDGVFTIDYVDETGLFGTVEANGGTLLLHARFERNDDLRRSFD